MIESGQAQIIAATFLKALNGGLWPFIRFNALTPEHHALRHGRTITRRLVAGSRVHVVSGLLAIVSSVVCLVTAVPAFRLDGGETPLRIHFGRAKENDGAPSRPDGRGLVMSRATSSDNEPRAAKRPLMLIPAALHRYVRRILMNGPRAYQTRLE